MLLQFVTVLQGVLAPALLVMALSVMLTVGEGRDKPLSAYWRLAGFVVGFAGAVVFAALRATAVITQRTFVNYPTLWCCVILDVAVFVIVLFARRITADWHNHRALLDIANLVAALAIAATTFRALPDVILRLTIFVEPGDPIFTSDMLLRALGFALGAAVAIIAALIFRTMRSTAVRWSFTTAVLLLVALLFAQHFTDLAQILQSKRIVSFPTAAFLALVWGINHQRSLTIAMALVFAIPAIASIVMGFKVKPTGANEAIARTHIAFRRRAKAAGAFSLVAMICVTVALTYGVAQTQKVVTLSPPEKRKNEGLFKVFAENFPIADTRNNFVLEFLDYYIDPPRYTIEECLERGLTYSVPLKAKLKLYCTDPDHEDFATVIQDVYLGPIPYMTAKGTFVINGAERVVVSQLHRSPGVFFGQSIHANGTKLYSARIIPFRGSWIEFATDINNVMYAYIDRKKKLPVTTLLRAIGFETDKDILEIFGLAEDLKVSKASLKKAIGRRLAGNVVKAWVEDFVDEDTGEVVSIERTEIVIPRETVLEESHIADIIESGVQNILLHKEDSNTSDYSIIFNTLQKDSSNSEKEAVLYIYRQLRNAEPADDASAREVITNLFFSEKRYDLGEVGRYRINKKLNLSTSPDVKVLTKEDIIEIIKYLIELINSNGVDMYIS